MSGIVSFQSYVFYEHAGNSAAVFPIQRKGQKLSLGDLRRQRTVV